MDQDQAIQDPPVSGVVKDILTKPNHPRGRKVRLEDGRIGRITTEERNRRGKGEKSTNDPPKSDTWCSIM